MATASPAEALQDPSRAARKITGWYIAAAVLFIVLGMLAIMEPFVASLAVSRLVGWLLFNGIIALLLGGMIWLHWPSSSVWALGILTGMALLMTGTTRLMFAFAARRLARQAARA